MPRYRRLVATLWQLLLLLVAAPALAAPNHITAELVAESAVAPGGTVTLAIRMRPDAGWHGYWINPGDAGLGLTLDWQSPTGPGYAYGAQSYPVPGTLLIAGLMNHVYEREYAVLVPLTVPAGAAQGVMPLAVQAQWLACSDTVCVPEQAELSANLAITTDTAQLSRRDPRFDAWRAAMPAPLGAAAQFSMTERTMRIGIPLPAGVPLEAPHLFLADEHVVDYAAPQAFRRKGDLLIVEIPRPRLMAKSPDRLRAVLRLNRAGDGVEIEASPGPVPTGGDPVSTGGAPAPLAESLPLLLLGALVGGLLLNVMPCVFPILSLKALSLARAGESEAEARAEGLAYGAGVILACMALGALLLALRAGGSEVGWAFQLQEPGVVAVLLLLAVAITANLLGLFEFAVPGFARAGAPKGAFATGLLAAFVATPCTGPFMAAAMGAALLLPAPQAMALFAALGLGIALPFLAVAFIPALRRRLPRPGAWMVGFRRWMALPMGLTALALAWLAWRLGGAEFAALAIASAIALCALLLAIGRRQRRGQAAPALLPIGIAALFVLAFAALPQRAAAPVANAVDSVLPAQPFSEQALAAARASGKPVFAWFTADWCLTCKVNERVAIEREDVRDAFARAGVVVLRGDWTRRDPAITRYLTAQGAAGVPLYVWYPADGSAPRQLPQLLSPEALVSIAENRE